MKLLLRRGIVYCMVLSLFVGVGYVESKTDGPTVIARALEQAEAVSNPANRNVVLARIAVTYLQNGSVKGALATADKISEPYAQSLLLIELARLSAKQGATTQGAGFVEEAMNLIDEIGDPDQQLFVLLKAAEVSNAFQGLKNMITGLSEECDRVLDSASAKDTQLRAARMAALAGQGLDCGRGALALLDDALDIATEKMEDAFEIAPRQEDAHGNITVLDHVALGYLQMNEPGKALEVIKGIEDRFTRFAASDRMAFYASAKEFDLEMRLRQAGDRGTDNLLERVLEDVKEALVKTKENEDVYQKYAAQVDVADGFATLEGEALAAFGDGMELVGQDVGEVNVRNLLAELKPIKDRYNFATALYRIAHQYTSQAQYDNAIEVSEAIDDPYYRAFALMEVAAAGGNIGRLFPPGRMLDADNSLRKKKNVLQRGVDVEMKEEMDEVFKVLNTLENAKELTEPEKQEQFLVYLENYRYGKHQRRYFKVYDSQGKLLEEPYLPELEGKDLSYLLDANGNEFFTLLSARIDEQESGQGVVSYMWPGNELKKMIPTIFLIRFFEQWGWYVATGAPARTIEDLDLYEDLVEDRSAASPI